MNELTDSCQGGLLPAGLRQDTQADSSAAPQVAGTSTAAAPNAPPHLLLRRLLRCVVSPLLLLSAGCLLLYQELWQQHMEWLSTCQQESSGCDQLLVLCCAPVDSRRQGCSAQPMNYVSDICCVYQKWACCSRHGTTGVQCGLRCMCAATCVLMQAWVRSHMQSVYFFNPPCPKGVLVSHLAAHYPC